ncbi:MAG: VOC family protein [Alphaproteobacteria bacterium]|nr:VOC family protein [Alphaproteobacteria bacterium]
MSDWSIERLYHTVINATDLDRTVAFYEALGFRVLNDRRDVDWPDFIGPLFGLTRPKGRGVLMNLPADPEGPMLDIIQWVRPVLPSPPDVEVPPRIIAFRVRNVHACAEDLARRGIPTFALVEPQPRSLGVIGCICARDPDGTLIELIQLEPGIRHSRANEALGPQ